MTAKMQLQDGKDKWKNSNVFLTNNCWESMLDQINSSGIFSWGSRHCRFFRKIQDDLRDLKNLQTGSSSCQYSTTSLGQEKETMEFVFRIQKKSRNTRRDSRKDTGRFWVLETKRSGTKWDSATTQMVERFKDTGHPAFKSISALSSGILKKKNGRDTIHFNADASESFTL